MGQYMIANSTKIIREMKDYCGNRNNNNDRDDNNDDDNDDNKDGSYENFDDSM